MIKITQIYMSIVLISSLLYAEDSETSSLKPNYTFSNININYFDWSQQSQKDSAKGDFSYLGYEGGAGWNSATIYGFLNIENPTYSYREESPKDLRFTSLVDLDINLKKGLKIHMHNFSLHSESYYVNDFVLGMAYKIDTNFGLWFRPYIGIHHTYDTYYSGINGYMGGWVFNYDFNMFDYKFSLSQWNEIEFDRDENFYLNDEGESIGDGKSWGINGALSLWMHFTKSFTVGTQYRYAKNKLGYTNYQSGMIYTLKYNF